MKFIYSTKKLLLLILLLVSCSKNSNNKNQNTKSLEKIENNYLNLNLTNLSNTQYLYKDNFKIFENYIVNHHYKFDDIEFDTNIIIDSLDKLEKISTSTFSRGIVGVFSNNNNPHASYNYSKISDLFFNLSEYLNTKIEDLELEEVDID
jgi:PBP1b-binding outer membrane lipoprotein LpoB